MNLTPRILWQDEDLLAVDKPAGLLSHPSADPQRADLVSWLKQNLDCPDLVMHHRLDLDTSGILVLTLSKRACAPLAQQFHQRTIQKVYRAWVCGQPPAAGQIDQALGQRQGRVSPARQGLPALTSFRRLGQKGELAEVELQPHQGRKHQLRVHCQSQGWPILGDPLYGGRPSQRLWLHAQRLSLLHPISLAPLDLSSPLPPDWSKRKDADKWPKPAQSRR